MFAIGKQLPTCVSMTLVTLLLIGVVAAPGTMLQKCHQCVPALQIFVTYMSHICLAMYIFITTVCIRNFHHPHDQVRGLVYANMESGMQNYSSTFDIHQAACILDNTLLLLLDFK